MNIIPTVHQSKIELYTQYRKQICLFYFKILTILMQTCNKLVYLSLFSRMFHNVKKKKNFLSYTDPISDLKILTTASATLQPPSSYTYILFLKSYVVIVLKFFSSYYIDKIF